MKPRAIPEKMTIWNRYFKMRPFLQGSLDYVKYMKKA